MLDEPPTVVSCPGQPSVCKGRREKGARRKKATGGSLQAPVGRKKKPAREGGTFGPDDRGIKAQKEEKIQNRGKERSRLTQKIPKPKFVFQGGKDEGKCSQGNPKTRATSPHVLKPTADS